MEMRRERGVKRGMRKARIIITLQVFLSFQKQWAKERKVRINYALICCVVTNIISLQLQTAKDLLRNQLFSLGWRRKEGKREREKQSIWKRRGGKNKCIRIGERRKGGIIMVVITSVTSFHFLPLFQINNPTHNTHFNIYSLFFSLSSLHFSIRKNFLIIKSSTQLKKNPLSPFEKGREIDDEDGEEERERMKRWSGEEKHDKGCRKGKEIHFDHRSISLSLSHS